MAQDHEIDLTAAQHELLRRHHQLSQELLEKSVSVIHELFHQWEIETDHGERSNLVHQLRAILQHNTMLDTFAYHRTNNIADVNFTQGMALHWFGHAGQEYEELNHRLFHPANTHWLTKAWIQAALLPGKGDQTVTLQEARAQWIISMAGIPGRHRYFLSNNDFNRHPSLPKRITVRQNGNSRQGWHNMRYQPEAGAAAMEQLLAESQLGNSLHQAGAYPWEIASAPKE